MRFEDLLDRHERRDLSQLEPAELLGISDRRFRRWRLFPAGTQPVALPNAGAPAPAAVADRPVATFLAVASDTL